MFLRVACMAALLLAPLNAQAPAKPEAATPQLPDAREIINRHITAVGGRDAILARKSMHAVGTITVPAQGLSGPMELFTAASPNRTHMKFSVGGIGDIAEGFDGSHGWSMSPMTGPMLKVGKELTQAKFDADFYSDLRNPKTYLSVKTVEKTTYDGRPAYKVALSRIDGAEDFDFYDAETGLRSGSIITRESAMGPMTVSSVVSGYQKFGNVLVPTAQTQKVMGVEQVLKITSVEFDKVDPAVFTPPDAIKALIK